jgi:hypothetical protein
MTLRIGFTTIVAFRVSALYTLWRVLRASGNAGR